MNGLKALAEQALEASKPKRKPSSKVTQPSAMRVKAREYAAKDLAKQRKLSEETIYGRIKKHWPDEDLLMPKQTNGSKRGYKPGAKTLPVTMRGYIKYENDN